MMPAIIWVLMIWHGDAGYIPERAFVEKTACQIATEPTHRTPDICTALRLETSTTNQAGVK